MLIVSSGNGHLSNFKGIIRNEILIIDCATAFCHVLLEIPDEHANVPACKFKFLGTLLVSGMFATKITKS